jgi:type VI secretion system protein ImpK
MALSDCFIGLFAYGAQFRRKSGESQPSYEQVRSNVLSLLRQSESLYTSQTATAAPAPRPSPVSSRRMVRPESVSMLENSAYDQARYAVCAWMDETILSSSWAHKNQWRPELLQRVYYHSSDAGQKFFERLRGLGAHDNDIREVYFLCLALGFKGRYCGPEAEGVLRELKERELKFLLEGKPGYSMAAFENSRLFPEAFQKGPSATKAPRWDLKRRSTMAVVVGVPVAALCTLFLIYSLTLTGLADNILKGVR